MREMPPTDPEGSDEELVDRFYAGEEVAFSLLMERWRLRLTRVYSGRNLRREEVEDLIQEVAVRLYLTRERLSIDTSRTVAPYILAVARNLAMRMTLPKRSDELIDRYFAQSRVVHRTPEGLLQELIEAFEQLPELEQNYLLLCKQHGLGDLSHGEIAARLGKSPQYITLVSHRTLAHLRKKLARRGYRVELEKPPTRHPSNDE
jgi:RNA polymerase sigma factor (sigma-70 family)